MKSVEIIMLNIKDQQKAKEFYLLLRIILKILLSAGFLAGKKCQNYFYQLYEITIN